VCHCVVINFLCSRLPFSWSFYVTVPVNENSGLQFALGSVFIMQYIQNSVWMLFISPNKVENE
jgi:hypothetical protein